MHKKQKNDFFKNKYQYDAKFPFIKMTAHEKQSNDDDIRLKNKISCHPTSHWNQYNDLMPWLDQIEDKTSQKVLQHWIIVEKTLFDEENQLTNGLLFNECLQWRNLLTYLRICGKSILSSIDGPNTSTVSIAEGNAKRYTSVKEKDFSSKQWNNRYDYPYQESHKYKKNRSDWRQIKKTVIDIILNFICKKILELEYEKEDKNISNNFDKYSKMLSEQIFIEQNFYYNGERNNWLTDQKNYTVHEKEELNVKEKKRQEQEFQFRRNMLNAIFNEKIIVRSIPFASSTRKSFSTLHKTAVHCFPDIPAENDTICSYVKSNNVRRNLSQSQKTFVTGSHIQTWNRPVCSKIWSKSMKLTPIDVTSLPSTKRRPVKTAENLSSRYNPKCLSPMLYSVQSTFHNSVDNDFNHSNMYINGSHICHKEGNLRVPQKENCMKNIYSQ